MIIILKQCRIRQKIFGKSNNRKNFMTRYILIGMPGFIPFHTFLLPLIMEKINYKIIVQPFKIINMQITTMI